MALESYSKIAIAPTNTTDYYGTRYPTASTDGTFKVGDRVWNTAPSTGAAAFWVCITAGSPGTWEKVVSAPV